MYRNHLTGLQELETYYSLSSHERFIFFGDECTELLMKNYRQKLQHILATKRSDELRLIGLETLNCSINRLLNREPTTVTKIIDCTEVVSVYWTARKVQFWVMPSP